MKKTILLWLLLSSFFILGACANKNTDQSSSSNSRIDILQNNRDLGEIPMDEGKVKISFEFTNTWNEAITLWKAETSCMCTDAVVLDSTGKNQSALIQMAGHAGDTNLQRVLLPGEKAILLAIFDPNAHGPNAIWPISRDVYIQTNSSQTPTLDFKFYGNVVKTRTTQKEDQNTSENMSESGFVFQEDSYDFWKIKQSWGKVSHDFTFTYMGENPIKITGIPTSCACTSATISANEFKKGERGVLTVTFNPNLHEEPKGRFFKTVSLLTDQELETIPEVKIWTEIDLDLWEEAFELKDSHSEEQEQSAVADYKSLTVQDFDKQLEKKDFFLLDVHIPQQVRIEKTDAFIPYNEIESQLKKLPQDKNVKIVVYCRSGSMSRAAAYILAQQGYTNVYDLTGGKEAYDEYKTESQ